MNTPSALINMVKQQLRTGDVLSDKILSLYDELPRCDFVPENYRDFAYSDMPIPLAHDQYMLTPLEEATILQNLDLQTEDTVLEIGTGSGFFSAMLSKLCKKVITVEYFDALSQAAAEKLKAFNIDNVSLITADGSRGWLDNAPYNKIVFSGGLEKLDQIHRLQVMPGGKLFAIIGKPPAMQGRMYSLDHHENWTMDILFETNTPLLVNKLRHEHFEF